MTSIEAAIASIGEHSAHMPIESEISLPIVARVGHSVHIMELIVFTYADPTGTTLSTPQYVATYDLGNARFLSLVRTALVLPDLPPAPWTLAPLPEGDPDEIDAEFDALWRLYDTLIAAFVAETPAPAAAAGEFLRSFNRHEQPLLRAYHRHFGGEFVGWVEAGAR